MPNRQQDGNARRSVSLEYLYFNADDTIQPLTRTKEGIRKKVK